MKHPGIWWGMAFLSVAAAGASLERKELASVLALKPDVARGAELFETCAGCHGADGGGVADGSVPRVAGQHYRVVVRQLIDFRRGKRWDMNMEGVATSHNVIPELQDIADVARYVSQLPRSGRPGVGDGSQLEEGARLYAARCASCHGAEARGDDSRGIPRLSGQHAGYLARQLYDAVDGRRPPLTRTHRAWLERLDHEQLQGLTDHLSRLGGEGAAP